MTAVATIGDVQPIVLSPRRVLVVALLLALVVALGARYLLQARTSPEPVVAPIVGSRTAAPPAASRLVVYVVGAVRRPGLYRLVEGARVADVVARAGGLIPKADRAGVNLAAPVVDGQQVVVPRRLPAAVAAAEGAPSLGGEASASPVQLSVATVQQLDELPGIGPVTAQKIVDYRTAHGAFRSVEELDEVPGIGPARVEQLRGLVVP